MFPGLLFVALSVLSAPGEHTPQVSVTGKWQISVSTGTLRVGSKMVRITSPVQLRVEPPGPIHVIDERYDRLPLFNPAAAPWGKGERVRRLITMETTAEGHLYTESFLLKSSPGGAPLKPGADYALEGPWATFGRLVAGAIAENQPVFADYTFEQDRLDSIVVDRNGKVTLQEGKPQLSVPEPPVSQLQTTVLANIWVPARLTVLTGANLYPILESRFPEPHGRGKAPAQTLLPKTWAKLHNGQTLNILAWGDSVTAGGQASDEAHRYQDRFVTLLQQRFARANIHLTTLGWGGRNTESFLKEPPGSPWNFEEKVIQPHPDLIVMEFVNDAYLTPEQIEARYSALLQRFQEIGAEWILLTPHYVRPDWMGAPSVRVETDPRPYVTGVRAFAAKHQIALADASLRWGHLLKEGIPYTTLLSNSINHPNDHGHELFAQALMELFRP